MLHKILICAVMAATYHIQAQTKDLETIYNWKLLEYDFPSTKDRRDAIVNGNLVSDAGTPIDVGVDYRADGRRRVFTTIPRFTKGIPFSLAIVSDKQDANGPLLQAYPAYSWHSSHGSNCGGITSAFRVAIDECNRMWVIDSGVVSDVQHCPPQVLVFDLASDTLLLQYQFPSNIYIPAASLFITPIVDISDPPPIGQCRKTMVYIADVNFHGLVVYDLQKNDSWRIENKLMYPDPNFGTHTIAGESFDLMDGIFAMSVDPRRKRGERYLYFHALASDTENAVPLRVLNEKSMWEHDSTANPRAFKQIGKRGVECAAEAMDSRGFMYCVTLDPPVLFSWHIDKPYHRKSFNVLANNPQTLQFASGMKVVKSHSKQEELWMSTCRFQKIAAGTQNPNEINFRIMACKIDDLLDGSRTCGGLVSAPQNQTFLERPTRPGGLHANLIFN